MPTITFDVDASPDIRSDNYIIWATVGRERIRCQVSNLVFADQLGIKDPTKRQIAVLFETNRASFESAFLRMIEADAFTRPQDGWDGREVMLTSDGYARWIAEPA